MILVDNCYNLFINDWYDLSVAGFRKNELRTVLQIIEGLNPFFYVYEFNLCMRNCLIKADNRSNPILVFFKVVFCVLQNSTCSNLTY